MRDAKRRQNRHEPDITQPCRPARRIAMQAQAREELRLGVHWR
jgi:hypothetical protein